MKIARHVAAALLAFAVIGPAATQITRAEQQMVATVDAEQQRTVDLLETWVNQNSGTLNFAGVRAVGDMVRAELEPLGFKVQWIDTTAAGRAGARAPASRLRGG